MGLTCGCDFEFDLSSVTEYAYPPEGYAVMSASRRKRCTSCGVLIDVGVIAANIKRVRIPKDDVELLVYGDDGEIPLADKWLCERCADLFFSLEELGYCVSPYDDMRELVHDYADDHAAQPPGQGGK